jgi:hypothetical protein
MQAEPPKADPPKRKRRWFQFSLRSLLIVVTALAIPCGYLGWQAKVVRERKAMLDKIVSLGGGYLVARQDEPIEIPNPPLLRRWLGDERVAGVWFRRSRAGEDTRTILSVLPEVGFVDADTTDPRHPVMFGLKGRITAPRSR